VFASANKVIVGPYRDGDNFWHVWQLWTVHRSLVHGTDPAFTDRIYALIPGGVPIFVENWLSEIVGAFLGAATTPLVAYNILIWSSFALGGIVMYALAGEFTRSWLARMMAGVVFTFSTYHFWRAAGHLGEVTIEFMPLYAWRLIVLIRRPTPANAVWAALSLAAVPLSEVYYGPYFVYPFTLLVLIGLVVAERAWFTRRNSVLLTLAMGAGLILTAVPLRSFFAVAPDVKALVASYAQSSLDPLSADAATLFAPNSANPLFGSLTAGVYAHLPSPYPVEQAVYLGWIGLALAVLAAIVMRRERWVWFWGAVTLAGVLLSLGPHLHVAGHTIMPLPFYEVLYHWPGLSNFRAPNRLIVLAQVGLAVLAAYGVAIILERAGAKSQRTLLLARTLVVACMFASVAECLTWSFPLPAAPAIVAWPYSAVGQEQGDDALLELPLTNAGSEQFAQTVHGKRLVGGFTSRITANMTASLDKLPLTSYFTANVDSPIMLAGARAGETVDTRPFSPQLRASDVRYVALHYDQLDPDSLKWARDLLIRSFGQPRFDDAGVVAIWQLW
jgi:hypothetical protein